MVSLIQRRAALVQRRLEVAPLVDKLHARIGVACLNGARRQLQLEKVELIMGTSYTTLG